MPLGQVGTSAVRSNAYCEYCSIGFLYFDRTDDLTYFGKAFLADQLNQGADILSAFTGVTILLHQRASAEKLKVATLNYLLLRQ
jgi:hypothetical protein